MTTSIHIYAPKGAYRLTNNYLDWHTFDGWHEPVTIHRRKRYERIEKFKKRCRLYVKIQKGKILSIQKILQQIFGIIAKPNKNT